MCPINTAKMVHLMQKSNKKTQTFQKTDLKGGVFWHQFWHQTYRRFETKYLWFSTEFCNINWSQQFTSNASYGVSNSGQVTDSLHKAALPSTHNGVPRLLMLMPHWLQIQGLLQYPLGSTIPEDNHRTQESTFTYGYQWIVRTGVRSSSSGKRLREGVGEKHPRCFHTAPSHILTVSMYSPTQKFP